jgi:crossover junction endodeoxyribonuclease RusA
MIELSLPWPPTANTYWRRAQGRVLISRDGRAYQRTVKEQVMVQRVPAITDDRRLAVEILAFPPDRRKRDLDNLYKALLDSVSKAGVIPDDEQIDDLRICRMASEKPGRVQVHIKPLEAPFQFDTRAQAEQEGG